MTAFALVSGTLFRSPETRTSTAGKQFVTAPLKVKNGDALQWWRIVAFSETVQVELMRLGEGDGLAVQGPLRIETYEKSGETKLALSVTVEQVLAVRPPPKKHEPKTDARSRQQRLAGTWSAASGDPNDDIGF